MGMLEINIFILFFISFTPGRYVTEVMEFCIEYSASPLSWTVMHGMTV